ncbi:hypothetical protein [Microbacterium sp. LTA6]
MTEASSVDHIDRLSELAASRRLRVCVAESLTSGQPATHVSARE